MKEGDIVELVEDTAFYKKGTQAIVINETSLGNREKCEIRYVGEPYFSDSADVVPKKLLKIADLQQEMVKKLKTNDL